MVYSVCTRATLLKKKSDEYVVPRLQILTILIRAYLPRIDLLQRVLCPVGKL